MNGTKLLTLMLAFLTQAGTPMESTQYIKDVHNKVIAVIRPLPGGVQQLQTVQGKTLGSYNPKAGPSGITKDVYGKTIGQGNQLLFLLR